MALNEYVLSVISLLSDITGLPIYPSSKYMLSFIVLTQQLFRLT